MSQPYPIIRQSPLKEPSRRRRWGPGGARRTEGEVPTLNPHEVLVYRVNGHFIVDDGRRGLDDSRVVNATSVSVVNMRRGADVETIFEIASMDAANFAVQVNFVCSVIDPIMVVRDGQTDASEALLAYLKGYQPLFELGLRHPLSEINAVRREAGFHIKAFTTVNPPEIPGMSIALANVQVMTPDELAQHEERRRAEERERILEAERLQGQQTLKQQEQDGEQALKQQQAQGDRALKQQHARGDQVLRQQQHEADQLLKERQQEGERVLRTRQQEADQILGQQQEEADQLANLRRLEMEQLLASRKRRFDHEQFESTAEILGNDSRQALLLAHIQGELSADEYGRRLRLLDEEDWRLGQEVREAERLAREKAAEIARADDKERAVLAREDAKETAAMERADKLRELEWAHDDQRYKVEWHRTLADQETDEAVERRKQEYADKLRKQEWARQDKREAAEFQRALAEREAEENRAQRKHVIEVELEILREFNKRGLLDNYYPDINEMMRRIRGEPNAGVAAAAQPPIEEGEAQLELPSSGNGDTADDLEEDDLREEDGD
jgi:hypothetical protein